MDGCLLGVVLKLLCSSATKRFHLSIEGRLWATQLSHSKQLELRPKLLHHTKQQSATSDHLLTTTERQIHTHEAAIGKYVMLEENRVKLRQKYGQGWNTWNPELLCSSLAEDFYFDDPALEEPIAAEKMSEYMVGWKDRVNSLGGAGVITSKDRVKLDVDGACITWHWWGF